MMPVFRESQEIVVAMAPLLPSLHIAFRPATRLPGWVAQIVGSCFCALVGIGLTLMRLTAMCLDEPMSCSEGFTSEARVPGIIRSCYMCVGKDGAPVSHFLNDMALPVQGVTALICLAISFLTFIRFIRKTRQGILT